MFKFRIDFPMQFPLNLPSVKFQARQVFSPLVHLDSGMLDVGSLFELPDRAHSDQNYLDGRLVQCFDGFCKHLLSKIWVIFHDPLFPKTFYMRCSEVANPLAVQLH